MASSAQVNTFYCAIDGFLIDAIISESHELDNEVTEYPVESGADITDNVRPKPLVVTMECLVTNTPIGAMAGVRKKAGQIGEVITSTGAGSDVTDHTPTGDCYQHLKQIRDNREPVKIVTTLETYDNMVLRSLSIPRATGRGDELRFTAEFQKVQIVSNTRSTRVAIPAAKGDHTVSAKPKPTGTGTPVKQTFVNALSMIKPDSEIGPKGSGMGYASQHTLFWYDVFIGGWRAGLVYKKDLQGYAAYKLAPFSVVYGDFSKNPSDQYWKAEIEDARSPFGNTFDPYDQIYDVGAPTSYNGGVVYTKGRRGGGIAMTTSVPIVAILGDEDIQEGVFDPSGKYIPLVLARDLQ